MRGLLLCGVLVAGLPSVAAIAAETDSGDLYVLSVGVESEQSATGVRDQYAGDAVFVREALLRAEPLYATTYSRVLTGKRATREAVLDGLTWLAKSVGENDLVVIFFSVHGGVDPNTGHHLYLYDVGKPVSLNSEELTGALSKLKGRAVVMIDTCHAGGMISPGAIKGTRTAFLSACRAEEETGGQDDRADRPHGWYVISLCEALTGMADADRDGMVTLGEVENYLPGRAKQFYRAQNAFLLGSDELRTLPLSRVDLDRPAVELYTPKKKTPGRNPFGESDVHDPDGKDVQEFMAKFQLDGGPDDPNAAVWPDKGITGPVDDVSGLWGSRWKDDTSAAYGDYGKAEIKVVGDRVYIFYGEDYLFDLKRTGEKNDVLVGRYMSVSDENDTWPWVGRIVGQDRIDGQYPGGRWDFRRSIEARK